VRASIGANRINAAGVTGRGVAVALIDTGVTPVGGLDGAGKVMNGIDVSFDSGLPGLHSLDLYGHGTHLAGIIAGHDLGADPANPAPGQFLGVAPDATILNVKAGDQRGAVDVSQIIAAIGWVIDHRFDHNLNVRVLNLSYGTDSTQSYQVDPLAQAAEAAWKAGIVVVASAGNDGATLNRLADPAFDPYVIAVGAEDPSTGSIASFSTRGDGIRQPRPGCPRFAPAEPAGPRLVRRQCDRDRQDRHPLSAGQRNLAGDRGRLRRRRASPAEPPGADSRPGQVGPDGHGGAAGRGFRPAPGQRPHQRRRRRRRRASGRRRSELPALRRTRAASRRPVAVAMSNRTDTV